MAEWKIKVKDEDDESEEESEDFEQESEGSEEPEALEDILQNAPSRQNFRFNRSGVSLSLESEPVEDLEQGLRQVPTQTQNQEPAQAINAPQYSSNYERGDYENMKNIDKEIDVSGGALTTRESAMQPGGQRRMDINAWQQQNMERFDSQGEKYQVRKPEKFKSQEDLPFQNKNESRGFG